jgi:hypothetical protein
MFDTLAITNNFAARQEEAQQGGLQPQACMAPIHQACAIFASFAVPLALTSSFLVRRGAVVGLLRLRKIACFSC